jgi:hypothetical protein
MQTKKIQLYALVFILVFCVSVIYFNNFFSKEKNVESKLDQSEIIQSIEGRSPKSPSKKGTVVENKAIKNIRQKNRNPSAQVSFMPSELIESDLFKNTSWKIGKFTKAVNSEQKNSSDRIVGKFNNLFIVYDDRFSSDLSQFDSKNLIVVFDSRLKKIGVITGQVKVETDNRSQLEADLRSSNAAIVDSFEDIQTYFVSSQQAIFSLEGLYLFLKQKPYLNNVEIDVSDRVYEKN